MSTTQESNIAISFLNIHNVITRGLNVSIENVQDVLRSDFRDEERREGLFIYIRALYSVLHAHHLTEDEIAFPYFRDKMPEVNFDSLMYWHQEMVKILNEINQAVEKCEKNNQLETNLKVLENALTRLNEMWISHIYYETADFISKADELVPVEEQQRLVRLLAEHSLKNSEPLYLTVPFLLYNLPPEDRQVFSKDIPLEMLQNLVPIVWKPKWDSMKPYLLL